MGRSLFAELKRRNVFKAGIAYLALGWVVTQVTSTVAPAFNLPGWIVPVVVWIGVIGFPFVVAFSWIYEITPEGLKRESEVDRSAAITHITGRRMGYLIVGLLVLAIGFTAFDRFGPRRSGSVAPSEASAPAVATGPAASSSAPTAPPAAQAASGTSIAVLPFVNMSDDKSNEYFSDGISEELLNLLAKIPQLQVTARTSSFSFKGKEVGIKEIAKTLGVTHILEGSVRKSGSQVRITAQLINAVNDKHLWSETYDRTLDDIFKVQDEIAGDVVRRLQVSLMGDQPTARATRGDAFDAYLQASQLSRQHTKESLARATDLYQRAIELDPHYAPAYLGLAFNAFQINDIGLLSNEEAWTRARTAAERALLVDPNNAAAHAMLARLDMTTDLPAAARHLTEGEARDPNDPRVQLEICSLLSVLGRTEEAAALSLMAVRRDPLSAEVHEQLGFHLIRAHKPAEARSALEHALDISPGFDVARAELAEVVALTDPAHAYELVEQNASEVRRLLGRAMIGPKVGRQREADAALEELTRRYEKDWSYNIAYAYAYRGEADLAFVWLEKARKYNDTGLAFIVGNTKFDPIRADPRWLPFLRSIGRAPEQLAKIEFKVTLPKEWQAAADASTASGGAKR